MREDIKEEPTPCHAQITNLSLQNDGFARHPGTDDGIYIPPSVASASRLVVGEIREVHIVPNFPDKRETTPWLGVYVAPPAQAMPEAHRDTGAEDRVYRYMLETCDVYVTTAEAAKAIGIEPRIALRILNQLYRDGKIVRADVREPNKADIVANLWAVRVEDFTG